MNVYRHVLVPNPKQVDTTNLIALRDFVRMDTLPACEDSAESKEERS